MSKTAKSIAQLTDLLTPLELQNTSPKYIYLDLNMFSKEISIAVFLMVAVIIGVFLYPKSAVNTPVDSKMHVAEVVTLPIKVESISLDYAEAHRQVMKKREEVVASSF